ncbi:hypothetical protein ALI22I_08990 [Saccharothrix sp. ALI-22-I]|nr:hypothetical protein ALI22I_08990 [Saccharothrix sp. ALI-22-I]
MYYAGTTFGSQRSAIGLATATNIEGPWTDQGEVLRSQGGMSYNVIDSDPIRSVVNGQRATPYLAWASRWRSVPGQLGVQPQPRRRSPLVHLQQHRPALTLRLARK